MYETCVRAMYNHCTNLACQVLEVARESATCYISPYSIANSVMSPIQQRWAAAALSAMLAMALCSSGALGLSTVTVMPIVVAATFDAKLNNTKLTSFGDLAVSAAIPAASKCAAGGPALPSARS